VCERESPSREGRERICLFIFFFMTSLCADNVLGKFWLSLSTGEVARQFWLHDFRIDIVLGSGR